MGEGPLLEPARPEALDLEEERLSEAREPLLDPEVPSPRLGVDTG